MTINQYITHHKLQKVSGGAHPAGFAQKFAVTDEVDYYADPPALNRWIEICRKRNFGAVYRSNNGSITTTFDLDADLPGLNALT